MPRTQTQVDQAALYEAALQGLELQKQRIEEQISAIRSLVGAKKPRAEAAAAPAAKAPKAKAAKKAGRKAKGRGKRVLSPEARARIAEAQRKRWAAFRTETEG